MDGNRRWAKAHNLPLYCGHEAGEKTLRDFLKNIKEIDEVKYVSVYAFSTENWNREKEEIEALFKIFQRAFENLESENQDIKIKFIGRRDRINNNILRLMQTIEKKTENKEKYGLQIAIDYSGKWDIENAMVTGKFANNFGPVDLLIRTGGETRLSNYMLYDIAYAEILFLDKFWPDFTKDDLHFAIEYFKSRNRRFGS